MRITTGDMCRECSTRLRKRAGIKKQERAYVILATWKTYDLISELGRLTGGTIEEVLVKLGKQALEEYKKKFGMI